MTDSERIYIDTSIFHEWFVRMIKGDKTTVEYVKFLADQSNLDKYISIFTVAELVETLMKESRLQGRVSPKIISNFIDIFRNTLFLLLF